MRLIISGEAREIKTDNDIISIPELLNAVKVEMPEVVSVELNGTIIFRDDYPATPIKNGDSVEFLYYMGGGGI